MVRLKPNPDNFFTCPECRSEQPFVNEIKVVSINILADCTCANCGFEFHQVLPVGHTVDYPLSIGSENGKLYQPGENHNWLSQSLLKAHKGSRKDTVRIEKIIFKKYEKVVILNTLDSLYGHVLLKLYNAFYHLDHQKDIGLILIIPKIFKWLIPKGCAEAWIVDLKLSELIFDYESIQKFVSNEFERFQDIFLSKAYSHPNFSTVDIARLTGVQPFNLKDFSNQKPTITFILREDRWWFKSNAHYLFYRVCRKLKVLSWGSRILSGQQNRLIKRTIKLIRKELPIVDFNVIGLGKTGSFAGYAMDERQWNVNALVEMTWCKTYAQSHVVIGVHGSNMLLPSALAAGCVEILPDDRYGNMVQDLSVRYTDRLQLFFYRFVDQFANPKSVGSKAIAIIRDYSLYHKNMCSNTYPAGSSMTILPIVDDFNH